MKWEENGMILVRSRARFDTLKMGGLLKVKSETMRAKLYYVPFFTDMIYMANVENCTLDTSLDKKNW